MWDSVWHILSRSIFQGPVGSAIEERHLGHKVRFALTRKNEVTA